MGRLRYRLEGAQRGLRIEERLIEKLVGQAGHGGADRATQLILEFWSRVLADGFDARESWSHGYINIYINHDENFGRNMAKLRGIIGRMVLAGKEVADAKAKTITVRLDCRSYPNVTVQYNCKLPKTSKCKIKISRKYEPELVCER